MLPNRIGLASRSTTVGLADLSRVAAAVGLQVSRDFQPLWNVSATVTPLPNPDSIPPGVWPIFVVDQVAPGEAGLHLNKGGQPYALVQSGPTWSLTASHECLEMLVDPSGNRLVVSTAIGVTESGEVGDLPGQKFNYIVEVCDPSEDSSNAYMIDDVLVSDFYTPSFFDPQVSSGVRYGFTGKLTKPRHILPNGYISWLDDAMTTLFQLQNYAGAPPQVLSGPYDATADGALRRASDRKAGQPVAFSHVDRTVAAGGNQPARAEWLRQASASHATTFRER